MADPAKLIQANWPKLFTNKLSKKCTYEAYSKDTFDPTSETQTETVVYSKTIYVVFDKIKRTYGDDSPVPSEGALALFPALDITVTPHKNHRIVEDVTGKKWEVFGVASDPVPATYELEVIPIG